MAGEKEVLDGIRESLEQRGYFHMANGRDIGAIVDYSVALENAVKKFLDNRMAMFSDSRAVDDDLVELASITVHPLKT